ncbi:AAA family ATPase [Patescibacteria group bacterium AH-259-L05]|nr:AAA family ATPase [Patescibacteria group bacterium AH-259-L05]
MEGKIMKREDLKVPAEKLRYVVDPQSLDFKDTTEVQPLRKFVGQKRAKDALRFALEMQAPGYDAFVSGPPHSGRKSLVHQQLERAAKKKKETIWI